MRGLVVVGGEADLLEVVGAGHAVGGLPHLLDGGQQEADQHRGNRDDDQQLDQREGRSMRRRSHGALLSRKGGTRPRRYDDEYTRGLCYSLRKWISPSGTKICPVFTRWAPAGTAASTPAANPTPSKDRWPGCSCPGDGPAAYHGTRGGIETQASGVVDILVTGRAPMDRLGPRASKLCWGFCPARGPCKLHAAVPVSPRASSSSRQARSPASRGTGEP